MGLLLLSAADIERLLPMGDAIEAMKSAFSALASGAAEMPPRAALRTEQGTTLVMPAALEGRALGTKLVSLFPGNPARGRPTLQGLLLLLDRLFKLSTPQLILCTLIPIWLLGILAVRHVKAFYLAFDHLLHPHVDDEPPN